MSQHHDGTEKKSGRVGESFALNIRGGSVNGFEDGALITDISGGGETEATDQTSAHIGENVTIQVGHNHDFIVVRSWVGGDLEASVVQQLGIEFDFWEVLGNSLGGRQEKTITHLHDGGLVYHANLELVDIVGILESESDNLLTGLLGNQLDALHHSVNYDVLNARIFSFGVLSDQDCVNSIVWSLVSGNGAARSDVGEEVECTAESKIKRDVSLANWGLIIISLCVL